MSQALEYYKMNILKRICVLLIIGVISFGIQHTFAKNYCCSKGTLLDENYECQDKEKISLDCSWKVHLDPVKYPFRAYYIDDNTGALSTSFFQIFDSSGYCINDIKPVNGTAYEMAIVCDEKIVNQTELGLEWLYALRFLQLLSCLSLLVTAYVYLKVPELKDVEGSCIFHFSINMSINYFFWAILLDVRTFLPLQLCITYAYFSYYCLLSGFFWMNILSFHTWKCSKSWNSGGTREVEIYKLICYGIPAIIITGAIISAHVEGLYETNEITCSTHEKGLLGIFLVLPIIILYIANVFFFVDAGIRLWNTIKQQTQLTSLKKLKYRCWLYIKLLLITGVLWGLQFVSIFISYGYIKLEIAMTMIANAQGIFILTILVLTRKKALRGIARMKYFGYQLFPRSWANIVDSETEELPFDANESNHRNNVA